MSRSPLSKVGAREPVLRELRTVDGNRSREPDRVPLLSPRLHKIIFTLVVIGIAVNFRVGLSYFFAQDDFQFLSRLARVHNVDDAVQLFLQNDHFYRPVARVAMLGIPYVLFGASPVGFHLFNLTLHLVNVLLVYRLLRLLGATSLGSMLGMALYGFYPVHLMPIIWVSGIQELSVTLFVLLACTAYFTWRSSAAHWRYGLALFAYAAALLSKESAILLPVWSAVVDYLRSRSISKSVRARSPLTLSYLGFAFIAAGFLLVRAAKADVGGVEGSYLLRLDVQSIWNNLQLYVLDMYGVRVAEFGVALLLIILTLGGLALLWMAQGLNRHRVVIGMTWVVCFLLPTLLLVDRHYSYYFCLPSIGLAIILSALGDRLSRARLQEKGRRFARASVIVLLCAWVMYAFIQVDQPIEDAVILKEKGERARELIGGVQTQFPTLPQDAILYVVGSRPGEENRIGFEGLFAFYYPHLRQIVFESTHPLTPAELNQPNVYVYQVPP